MPVPLANKMRFRHPIIRRYQEEMIEDVWGALEGRKHLMCHAATGIGKTDAVISPSLAYALENNLNLFFLTPKISQHKMAVEVLGAYRTSRA